MKLELLFNVLFQHKKDYILKKITIKIYKYKIKSLNFTLPIGATYLVHFDYEKHLNVMSYSKFLQISRMPVWAQWRNRFDFVIRERYRIVFTVVLNGENGNGSDDWNNNAAGYSIWIQFNSKLNNRDPIFQSKKLNENN